MSSNIHFWNQALVQNRLLYPAEPVVSWLARWRRGESAGGALALDVGFGSGRHLQLFRAHGFVAEGIELAPEALRILEGWPPDAREGIVVRQCSLHEHALANPERYSAVLLWGILPTLPRAEVPAALADVHRLLQPGGRALINVRTPENWFHGLGREVEPGTWLLDPRAGAYAGATYNFMSADEARAACEAAGFTSLGSERHELWKNRASERHAWVSHDLVKR